MSRLKRPRFTTAKIEGCWAVLDSSDTVVSRHVSMAEAQKAGYGYEIRGTQVEPVPDSSHSAWFIGPGSENADVFMGFVKHILQDYLHWRQNYFPTDPTIINSQQKREHQLWTDHLSGQLEYLLKELKAHFPTFSPRYLAHMVSEQSMPAILGYFAALLYNPNNVTSEAAPVTVDMELAVGRLIAKMLGYKPEDSWVHLCSGGTLANIEALWVARSVQFVPLMAQEFCIQNKLTLIIPTANQTTSDIKTISPKTLLQLPADIACGLPEHILNRMVGAKNYTKSDAYQCWSDFLETSAFNIASRGLTSVLGKLSLQPRIFVSEAAHYSFRKAVNLLGLGRDQLELVPVDQKYRLEMTTLSAKVRQCLTSPEQFLLAVMGILGTTEEGAIDPVHQILDLKQEVAYSHNQSFWLHVDAAWGGYFRTIFPQKEPILDRVLLPRDTQPGIEFVSQDIGWNDPSVTQAFTKLHQADSITVDPHKMGYIPYPAGICAFKDARIKSLIAESPPYITDNKVGPYIIEGSKPGAAAAACWLTHTTIPLIPEGHGKLVLSTILSAQRLYWYLKEHHKAFLWYESMCGLESPSFFTFFPLNIPDTNVVCFLIHLGPQNNSLELLNQINETIYRRFSIQNAPGDHLLAYMQEFFVSKTILKTSNLPHLAQELGISEIEIQNQGIFVLRSTIMNPFYPMAQEQKINYLRDFVVTLHQQAQSVLLAFPQRQS